MGSLSCILLAFTLASISNAVSGQYVTIQPNVRGLAVTLGSTLKLTCYLDGSQGSSPIWVNSSSTQIQTFTMKNSIYGSTLTIENYSEIGEKIFICSSDKSKAEITVITVEETKEGDHFYYGNKTAALTCAISGLEISPKDWLFKNRSLSGDKKFKMENSTIIIDKPNRDDAGPYTAVYEIKSSQGTFEHQCVVEYTAGPLVMDMARSRNLEQGDDLKLSCEVKGYPQAVIIWQRDKMNITRNGTIFSEYMGYKDGQIEIKNVQFDDAGNYTCTAYSERFGNSSTKNIIVRVKDPIAWVWPLVGILVEVALLAIIIIVVKLCERRNKDSLSEPPREKNE
ncbi:zwei Ig domain protein zig-1-like [Biomphalaria glabrata]|uniref:Zwei Ig domain protein zig-1-like n=1 Tax=Biomphalaria glabrata TaxID=6526 RepID=A0A9U8DTQ9_BIOGL|nr:zwei Ig domain protein zig-1-like [Biomphalaria glabrata]